MAFNTLEYLRDGKVDFVFHCTSYDYKHLIENVRKAPNRIEIINGFLPKLKEELPSFCFAVIYDVPEFADEAYELLNIKNITSEMLNNLLYNSPLGLKVLYENFDMFLSTNEDRKYFDVIIKYAFNSNNKELLHKLSIYSDLHTRFLFMNYLIDNYPERINEIYNDITEYTTSVTFEPFEQMTFLPELMKQEDISKLAVKLLGNNREKDYIKLKKFILEKYKYNNLASELLDTPFVEDPTRTGVLIVDKKKKAIQEDTFNKDSNTLFVTSANYRFHILFNHKERINQELLDEFAYKMRYFLDAKRIDEYSVNQDERDLKRIDSCGLSVLLEKWTEKYMDLSQSKEYGFVGNGTTCSCYRIGDYVIKIVKTKWSYEDEICPNIYLIAKDYEEIYVRNKDGIVEGGLEVQKYLTRNAKNIDPKYFGYFDEALEKLGYRRTDTLINGSCGENAMLLDTYYDADCPNPASLPKWFKEYPIVIIDRDRIYPKDKVYVKQLRSGY
ncbi:MAG: hypothetical protein IKF36_06775 [Bacilli bacterium]|nr:hypothetical protein [Bacilli bacterium]